MKVNTKIVDEVVSELAGEDVVPLVRNLKDKVNVSELKLASDLKEEINIVRNMLYRLYDNNLVSFTRKKDKKKGWYIYFWTFNQRRAKDLIKDIKQKKKEKLLERLGREKTAQFYICPNQCMRLDFEQSHDYNFKCPECGTLLDVEDNTKKIAEIENELKVVEQEIIEIESAKEEKPKRTPAKKAAKPKPAKAKPSKSKPVKAKSSNKPKKK